jgi:hypothetical protein
MPEKHSATRRHGGPGASHENRKNPRKSKPRGERERLVSEPKWGNVKKGAGRPADEVSDDSNLLASVSATRPGKRARPDVIVQGIKPKGPPRPRSAARPKAKARKRPRSR